MDPDSISAFDPGLFHHLFRYPMGLAIGEVHPRPAGTSEASSASGRPRSSSNATQDVADLRSGMKKSITDLFTNIGFVDQNGCLESTPFPLIADLVEGLRVRGEEGITIYEYDWVGGVRARTLSRPKTVSRLPPDGTQKQLPVDHRDIMYMYRLFVSTAVRAWNNTLAYAFGDGDAATSAHLSSTALYALSEVAARPDFQQLYELMASRPVAFWLTDYADEVCWDFDPQTIRGNCLANTLRLEAINYCHQKFSRLISHCHTGARIVPQHYSFFAGSDVRLHPPQSRPPGDLEEQAAQILAQICGVSKVGNLLPNFDIIPKVDFMIGPAVTRLATGAIYEVGLEAFSVMVNSVMKEDLKKKHIPPPGCRWMPLNLLSFASTFLILELTRAARVSHMFGMDICRTASRSSPSSYEGSINQCCTRALRHAYFYEGPSAAGLEARKQLHGHLAYLEKVWKLEAYFSMYKKNCATVDLPLSANMY